MPEIVACVVSLPEFADLQDCSKRLYWAISHWDYETEELLRAGIDGDFLDRLKDIVTRMEQLVP